MSSPRPFPWPNHQRRNLVCPAARGMGSAGYLAALRPALVELDALMMARGILSGDPPRGWSRRPVGEHAGQVMARSATDLYRAAGACVVAMRQDERDAQRVLPARQHQAVELWNALVDLFEDVDALPEAE